MYITLLCVRVDLLERVNAMQSLSTINVDDVTKIDDVVEMQYSYPTLPF